MRKNTDGNCLTVLGGGMLTMEATFAGSTITPSMQTICLSLPFGHEATNQGANLLPFMVTG